MVNIISSPKLCTFKPQRFSNTQIYLPIWKSFAEMVICQNGLCIFWKRKIPKTKINLLVLKP